MHSVGLVLHPQRDSAEAVEAVLGWAGKRGISVYGIADEIVRLNCAALPVSDKELGRRADLIVSLGGDGTMLRAMRLADGQNTAVLGVNLGKLGFLAEVDVPDLPDALSAIDSREFTIEPRLGLRNCEAPLYFLAAGLAMTGAAPALRLGRRLFFTARTGAAVNGRGVLSLKSLFMDTEDAGCKTGSCPGTI